MDDFLQSLAAATRLAVVIGGSGSVFAFGAAVICRWLKWAPINITVNLSHSCQRDEAQVTEESR
jgi:hypothetical protein